MPEDVRSASATRGDAAGVETADAAAVETVDVVIVGAGISGIGAAARLRRGIPAARVVIFESRDAIGGTWDLFRFPGVRSDSDMFTLGYPFRPWRDARSIAPADSIRAYIRDSAEAEGVAGLVRYRQRVRSVAWSSVEARWTLEVAAGDGPLDEESPTTRTTRIRCRFLLLCTGYYRYADGYTPELPGLDEFAGERLHPQRWPEDFEAAGKRIVVIGSGATAVTLVPALAERGAQVTMLQRSPTFVAAIPRVDRFAARMHRMLPAVAADRLVRARSLAVSTALYQYSRRRPDSMRALLLRRAAGKLPAGFDTATHFSPAYDPWDQRLCAVPGGDLFRAISAGGADVVTDRIERITAHGIRLASGVELPADAIVTATGLVLQPLGGIRLQVDGEPVDPAARLTYKGMMLDRVPNLAFMMGYVNASWTLKTDLVARWVVRALRYLRRRGLDIVVPEAPAGHTPSDFLQLSSGYVRRGAHLMPKQGSRRPWRVNQDYAHDVAQLVYAPLREGVRFRRAGSATR